MHKARNYLILAIISVILVSGLLSACGGGTQITKTPGPAATHPLQGYESCVACHSTGAGGAPKFPADHSGRTNDQCALCHTIK